MTGVGLGRVLLSHLVLGAGVMRPFMLASMVVVALVVIAALASTRRDEAFGYGPAKPVFDTSVQIVRERYARGEIGTADYERLVAELLGRS